MEDFILLKGNISSSHRSSSFRQMKHFSIYIPYIPLSKYYYYCYYLNQNREGRDPEGLFPLPIMQNCTIVFQESKFNQDFQREKNQYMKYVSISNICYQYKFSKHVKNCHRPIVCLFKPHGFEFLVRIATLVLLRWLRNLQSVQRIDAIL